MSFKRYAIYFVPAPGPFSHFGNGWLGWDAVSGTIPPVPDVGGLAADRAEITATPRKYGLHATIKPPFRLADGASPDALNDALAAFCADSAPVMLDGLEIARLGSFLALVPSGECAGINELAARAVKELDQLRAPLTDGEKAKRRTSRLSPVQQRLLDQWGYPYVMEEFRFHITLTGKLPRSLRDNVRDVLHRNLDHLLPCPFPVGALSLVGEGQDGMFRVVRSHALRG